MLIPISRTGRGLQAGMVCKTVPESLLKIINAELKKSHPSDTIFVTQEVEVKLQELWTTKETIEEAVIPSDLFFADTLPIKDLLLVATDQPHIADGKEFLPTIRVVVFPELIYTIEETGASLAGVIVANLDHINHFLIPFFTREGNDNLLLDTDRIAGTAGVWSAKDREFFQDFFQKKGVILLHLLFHMFAWYGIQIALLHPLTRTIFGRPKIQKVRGTTVWPKDEQGRKVKYQKIHHLTPSDFELDLSTLKLSDTEEAACRNFTRKTFVWHVVGHWRDQPTKQGVTRKFIQGYWKGPLKDWGRNLDKQERLIAQVGGRAKRGVKQNRKG